MKTGVVRFYNVDKNYGFIKAGLEKLVCGQKINYLVKLDKVKNKNYTSTLSLINDSH